jgi:hypothetical protein
MGLDLDIIAGLHAERRRTIRRLFVRRARRAWRERRDDEIPMMRDPHTGLTHWFINKGIVFDGEYTACGDDPATDRCLNANENFDPTLPLTCPRCRKLLEIAGGEEALALLEKPAEPPEPIVAEAQPPRGGYF